MHLFLTIEPTEHFGTSFFLCGVNNNGTFATFKDPRDLIAKIITSLLRRFGKMKAVECTKAVQIEVTENGEVTLRHDHLTPNMLYFILRKAKSDLELQYIKELRLIR